MSKPTIDEPKCSGCGSCVDVCPMGVFKMVGKKSKVTKPKECIGCRACEAQCETQCIVVND